MRLDLWLDVSCLFRTRSEAQKACKGGKVDVNGQSAKPHREVRPGDVIEITRTMGRRQRVPRQWASRRNSLASAWRVCRYRELPCSERICCGSLRMS